MHRRAVHEVAYAESVCPPTFRVFGIPLQPFTMGHAVLLTALRNPMLPWIGGAVGVGSWAEFVLVCMFPWKVSRWIVKSRWAQRGMKVLVRGRRGDPAGFDAPIFGYIRWHLLSGPELAKKADSESSVADSESPSVGYLISRFIEFGIPREEILATQYRVLRWDHAICVDRAGHQTLKAPLNPETRRRLVQEEAECMDRMFGNQDAMLDAVFGGDDVG